MKSISRGILGLEWHGEIIVIEVSIGEQGLDRGQEGKTSAYVRVELDIKTHRSQS